jgi:hypothetical protein
LIAVSELAAFWLTARAGSFVDSEYQKEGRGFSGLGSDLLKKIEFRISY